MQPLSQPLSLDRKCIKCGALKPPDAFRHHTQHHEWQRRTCLACEAVSPSAVRKRSRAKMRTRTVLHPCHCGRVCFAGSECSSCRAVRVNAERREKA